MAFPKIPKILSIVTNFDRGISWVVLHRFARFFFQNARTIQGYYFMLRFLSKPPRKPSDHLADRPSLLLANHLLETADIK